MVYYREATFLLFFFPISFHDIVSYLFQSKISPPPSSIQYKSVYVYNLIYCYYPKIICVEKNCSRKYG